MENFHAGCEDGENRQSSNGSFNSEQFVQGLFRSSSSRNGTSEQNLPVMNQNAADTEQQHSVQRQPADISSADSHPRRNITDTAAHHRSSSINGTIKQNLRVMNQNAADTEQQHSVQHQSADISSADSHPRRNIINTATDRRARKRATDRAYRKRLKEKQNTLEAEHESLKKEYASVNQRLEIQSKNYDELRNNFDELNHKFIKQLKNEQQMKSYLKTLEAKNESLKKEIVLLNQKLEIQSNELCELKKSKKQQGSVTGNDESGIEILLPASYLQNSSWLYQSQGAKWTPEENKLFESALAIYDEATPDRWLKVAAMTPCKTVGDVIKQYVELEQYVVQLEAL